MAALDYAIVAAAFLYRPQPAEILLVAVGMIFLAGILLRRGLLVHGSQALVLAPAFVRMAEAPELLTVGTVALVLATVAAIVILSWLVARGLRPAA